MELKKKKFKRSEVEELLISLSNEYENKIGELKDRNAELIAEKDNLLGQLNYYKSQEQNIVDTLKNAELSAKKSKMDIESRYFAEIETLKRFSIRWQNYFLNLKEKYPLYPTVQKACELKEKIDILLDKASDKSVVVDIQNEIDKAEGVKPLSKNKKVAFSPESKIQQYINATSDNGFNINDVLNPGELHLEDLCKELGLMEEEN